MAFKNAYLQKVYEKVEQRNPGEKEFLQAVREVLESFEPLLKRISPLKQTASSTGSLNPKDSSSSEFHGLTTRATFR